VRVNGESLSFTFRGKSGVEHSITLEEPRLARIIQRCQDLPGHELFQYLDANRKRQAISSDDVNAYLRELTGRDVTAKDFRTWGGTMLAAVELRAMGTRREPARGRPQRPARHRRRGRAPRQHPRRVPQVLRSPRAPARLPDGRHRAAAPRCPGAGAIGAGSARRRCAATRSSCSSSCRERIREPS
jgi:hypothetical protein